MNTKTTILIATAIFAGIGILIAFLLPPGGRSQRSPERSSPSTPALGFSEPEPAPRRYRPAPVSQPAKRSVDDILSRHHGMSKRELERSAELNELMNRFIEALDTPGMNEKIEQRIAALPPGKGNGHETFRMDFDMFDGARGRAWLEAAVSGDTQRMEDWVLNALDGAIFEFAFDPEMEITSDGVSLNAVSEN